jgi:hypothetical protein
MVLPASGESSGIDSSVSFACGRCVPLSLCIAVFAAFASFQQLPALFSASQFPSFPLPLLSLSSSLVFALSLAAAALFALLSALSHTHARSPFNVQHQER